MTLTTLRRYDAASRQRRFVRQVWWSGYALTMVGGLLIAAFARRRLGEPFLGVSLAVVLLILTGWLIRPRATLYVTLFLTAVSDIVTVWWFPFVKNFSSRESISFVADALTFSPLELSLYFGFAITTVRRYAHTRTVLPRTPLTWPVLVLTMFVAFGFLYGVGRGGDLRIAIMEGRSLVYIALIFVIVTNECTTVAHRWCALGAVLAGVTVQSIISIDYLNRLSAAERDNLESLNEHGSTLGHVLLFVTLLSLVLLGVRAPLAKWALLIALVPTAYVFIVGERRAGAATLMMAGFYLAIALFWRRRMRFWLITPVVALLLTLFVAAFSNSDSALGVQASAIRSVVDPGAQSTADQSSDIYRDLEAFDLHFTIRTSPLTGLGFGHAFYRPWPLPDIAFFPLSPFVPHNTILWIWIKLGFGGFAAMFYMFAKAIMHASDRVRHDLIDAELSLTLTSACLVAMYAVYSYVDISWDARNTVILGLALAVCAVPGARPNDKDREPSVDSVDETEARTPQLV